MSGRIKTQLKLELDIKWSSIDTLLEHREDAFLSKEPTTIDNQINILDSFDPYPFKFDSEKSTKVVLEYELNYLKN